MDSSYVLTSPPSSAAPLDHISIAPQASTSRLPPPLGQLPRAPNDIAILAPPSARDSILAAVESEDLNALRELASQPGGFESSELRKLVWPILLGSGRKDKQRATVGEDVHEKGLEPEVPLEEVAEPTIHRDEGQVTLDVNRSFVHYPKNISSSEKEALRDKLQKVIVKVLRRHPALRYFQGYHDIISVLLLTLDDEEMAFAAAEKMSLHRIRDSMADGLEPVLGYLKLVGRILAKVDPELSETVDLAAALPYFTLSWVLTLMSHDLLLLDVAARLFDFLLSTNPAMVSYFSVAIILLKKDELANLDEDSIDDPAIIHHTLSKLPSIRCFLPESPPSGSPEISQDDDCISVSTITDEDLMSTSDSRSRSSSPSLSISYSSVLSMSDLEDYSVAAYDDLMLSDPDISGPAFSAPYRSYSPEATESPPPSPKLQASVSLDDLITKTLELYEKYPLLGEESIEADEIMGSKSCIFTWDLSVEGKLSDEGADEIARSGVDIVLPDVSPVTIKEDEVQDLSEDISSVPKVKQGTKRSRRRKVELGLGTVLTLVGVAGILLAIYAPEDLKEFKGRIPWRSAVTFLMGGAAGGDL